MLAHGRDQVGLPRSCGILPHHARHRTGQQVHRAAAARSDVAAAAVKAGAGHVLDTSHVIFPNGDTVLRAGETVTAVVRQPDQDTLRALFSAEERAQGAEQEQPAG